MSRIANVGADPGGAANAASSANNFGDLEVTDFLQLMIAELSNQDPLSPMSNEDLVAQINQIREIGSTDKLTETLDSVLTSTNLTASSSMIGKKVSALSDSAVEVEGNVERVTIDIDEETEQRSYRLQVRDANDTEHSVKLSNVREVLAN